MKRIIAGLLSICLAAGLFTGVRAWAGNTEDESMIVMPGAVPVLGSSYEYVYHEAWGKTEYEAEFTQTADFAGIGFRGGVAMDCEIPIGQMPGKGFYGITLKPNTTVKADNNMFMMYVQMPVYAPDAVTYRWDEIMRFTGMAVEQGGKTYYSGREGMYGIKARYLAEDAAVWKETALTEALISSLFGSFRGYMMLDISSAPQYETWKTDGFDPAADYKVIQLTMQNGAVGGACGSFKVGGFYGIDTYKENAITAQIKNVPATKALSEYDPTPLKVTSTNMPGAFQGGCGEDSYGRTLPWGTGYGEDPYNGDGYENKTSLMEIVAGGAGNYNHHIAYTAETPHGYLSEGNNYKYRVNIKTTSNSENAAGAMLYLELPETGLGYTSMRVDAINQDGEWPQFKGTKDGYAYLETNGSEWVSGDVGANGELKLPDGFKGYVKLYVKGVTRDGYYMVFSWGLFGGSYGDVILGGTWSIVEDQNSCYVQFGDSDAVKVADGTILQPIKGTMKDPAYNGVWGNAIGGTANRVKVDKEGVTCTFSENTEPFGTHMMRKMSSENVVKNATTWYEGWVPIDSATNTAMIWMELPRSTSDTPVEISVQGPNCTQNGKWCWANSKNLQYAYLASDSNQWVNGVIPGDGSGLLSLPEGFKGYVKFDLSTLDAYRNGWKNQAGENFDYSTDYQMDQIGFKLSALGGEHGDFVLGTFTTITYDSNSIYSVISNSDTAVNGAPERLTYYSEDDSTVLDKLRGILAEIDEVDITDYDLIEQAIEIYEGLSQEYREQLTAEECADYEAKVTTYSQNYRPTFQGAAAYVPNGANMAGFRLGSEIDAAQADAEGYSVKAYGTVMMPKAAFDARSPKFDDKSTGAVTYTYENTDAKTALQWNVDYTSRNWKEYADDFYFRSYVVYSNGSNNITVWNDSVTNRANMSAGEYEASGDEMKELGSGFVKQVEYEAPYYATSITQAANLFGISVLSGHEYGNLNGDYNTKENTGIVDEADAALMRAYLVGKDAPRVRYMSDLDDSGELTVVDLVRLKRYLNDPANVSLGEKKNPELLDYKEPKDVYGEMSVSIIGDSISQGLNAGNLYDDSWASIFKASFNQHFGSNNMGFVSFNDGYADKAGETDAATYKEIHKITMEADDQWKITKFWTGTPGLYLYTANQDPEFQGDSVLNIELNRKEGGIQRHINGFYIYHTAGPDYGSFNVLVNDTKAAAVNCAADTKNNCARSEFIKIPENTGDEITIKIVKPSDVTGTVQIAGISYREDTTSPVVNNYSLSGCRLVDFSDDMLSQIATANVVVLTLGTNDLGTGCDIEAFKQKLDIVVKTCKENGSKLVVGDVIWNLAGRPQGTAFKLALKDAALAMGDDGYYIDFNEIPVNKLLDVTKDSYHPTKQGHGLMATKLKNFFGLD